MTLFCPALHRARRGHAMFAAALAILAALAAQSAPGATLGWAPDLDAATSLHHPDPMPDALAPTPHAPMRAPRAAARPPVPLPDLPATYAGLRAAGDAEDCLAVALYHEARGESLRGRRAVASVILERAATPGRWGATVCEVISPRQFTFYSGPDCLSGGRCAIPPVAEAEAWDHAVRLARAMRRTGPLPALRGADHYHAATIHPYWADTLTRVGAIDGHIFYADPRAARLRLAAVSARNPDMRAGPRPHPRPVPVHPAPRPAGR